MAPTSPSPRTRRRPDRRPKQAVTPIARPSPLRSPSGDPVTVVHLAAEYVPFVRTGGLAEAVAGLARFQRDAGMSVAAIVPLYRAIRERAGPLVPVGDPFEVALGDTVLPARLLREADPSIPGIPVYFVAQDAFFDRPGVYGEQGTDYPDSIARYAWFAKAAVQALPRVAAGPILLHAHDWHAALALVYLRLGLPAEYPRSTGDIRTVLSVHNAGFQGHASPDLLPTLGIPWSWYEWRRMEWYGQLNLLKAGLAAADAAVTVSPQHAAELRTEAGGFGLHTVFQWMGTRFSGILNGIDQREWDPAHDAQIATRYDAGDLASKAACKAALQTRLGLHSQPAMPVFGMAARLVTQKGIDLILGHPSVLDLPAQFVFLGTGSPAYIRALEERAAGAPGRIAVETGFTDPLEHMVMAGADFCLMPCQYEPCGLTQMRAQRYGTLPIVRHVGGLADTVEDEVTGFVFRQYDAESLLGAALRGLDRHSAPEELHRLRWNAMHRDFSWARSVERYQIVYERVLRGVDRAPEW